jgi:hypothetical protein
MTNPSLLKSDIDFDRAYFERRKLMEDVYRLINTDGFGDHWSLLLRKALIVEVGPYSDWDMLLEDVIMQISDFYTNIFPDLHVMPDSSPSVETDTSATDAEMIRMVSELMSQMSEMHGEIVNLTTQLDELKMNSCTPAKNAELDLMMMPLDEDEEEDAALE